MSGIVWGTAEETVVVRIGGKFDGVLTADDVLELLHLQVNALEDLGLGDQAGEFVDLLQF